MAELERVDDGRFVITSCAQCIVFFTFSFDFVKLKVNHERRTVASVSKGFGDDSTAS